METKRLERIIIITLALLNLFLLLVVLADRAQDRSFRQDTVDSLTALLEEAGVSVGPEAVLIQDCPAQCTVVRDRELEERRIQGLLGRHSSEDLGGSIWYYASDTGQLRMRGTGEMDLLLTGGGIQRGHSQDRAAKGLLSRAGIALYGPVGTEDGETLEYCCKWNEVPVYNAVLSFDFSNSRLYMVSGSIVFNLETENEPGAGMNSVSALVRFLELVRSGAVVCSRIETISAGYVQNVALSGESVLTPVWCIATDGGSCYINAVTGGPVSL